MPPTRSKIKQTIKRTIISSIRGFAEKSLSKKAKFQVLDLIIPKERKIRSIVGGLETSLGTTLWEPLAKELARMNGFEIIEQNLRSPANMPASLANTLSNLIEDRKGGNPTYSGTDSHDIIKAACNRFVRSPITDFTIAPTGFGVDIWLKKDNINYFFDTKTVQPNLGTLTKCMEQILNWYAFFYARYPEREAHGRIVFPYNPHNADFWEKSIGKGRPLDSKSEAWVEDEFWDFCSGTTGTFDIIRTSFKEIRNEGTLSSELSTLLD